MGIKLMTRYYICVEMKTLIFDPIIFPNCLDTLSMPYLKGWSMQKEITSYKDSSYKNPPEEVVRYFNLSNKSFFQELNIEQVKTKYQIIPTFYENKSILYGYVEI
jgi:hypothetical protein